VKHIRRLRCTTVEFSRKFPDTIAALRLIAISPVISRELWIRSPKGVWRFFRINDESFTELGNDGAPLTDYLKGMVVVPCEGSGALPRSHTREEGSSDEGMEITSQKIPVSDIKEV
jgi:hypothetical protein